MKSCLILGFFDGVHIAHQAVISSAVDFAKVNNAAAKLITFKDSPSMFFNGHAEYIYTRKDSVNKIKSLGVEEVIELDFAEIAGMTAEEYLKFLVNTYSPISISTGFNHTFGHAKGGNSEFLESNQSGFGYKYFCIPPQKLGDEVVSSTLIKTLLKKGEIEKANSMLGSNFILEGVVKRGAQIGRTIGFPTANIDYPANIVKIPFGVYKAEIDGKSGVLNWGMKPTVHNTITPVVEVHVLDFNDDLYGKNIKIEVVKRIRGEQKFSGLEELKAQIKKDIEVCSK